MNLFKRLECMKEIPPGGERNPDDLGINYWFWCFPCDTHHYFRVKAAKGALSQPLWTFNGDLECPTFHPSLKYPSVGCHLTLTAGVIEYHDDCTHAWKGKKAKLGEETPL